MNRFLQNKYFLFIVRILLGALFIFSAITKISDLDFFIKSLENYKLLPVETLNLVALIIPWMELIIGLFLILGFFVKESALLGSIMMGIFIMAIIISLARGLNIDCGCFGTVDGSKVGISKLIEDFIILLGFIWITLNGSSFLAVSKDKTQPTQQLPF